MALLIQPRHHARFRGVLQASFRLRREVFIDRLGWALPNARAAAETGMEIDEFDNDAASYLIKLDDEGQVVATLRITPSTKRNLSCDILAKQMGVEMPRGPHIVELSRLCADPGLSRQERRDVMWDMRISMGALFVRNGWTHSVGVGGDHHVQALIQSGVKVEILGPPMIFPGDDGPSFAIQTSDPERIDRQLQLPDLLEDPDEDSCLIARHGERVVA